MAFEPGRVFRTTVAVDAAMLERFAEFSGDRNPIHLDPAEASAYGYPRQVAHGAILVAALSKLIGMEAPGPGAVWMGQSIEWLLPVLVGDVVEVEATVERVSTGTGVLFLAVTARNQDGKTVMTGSAKVKIAERLAKMESKTGSGTRVALVTGASGGIGGAIASRLSADGFAVAAVYRGSKDAAERVASSICSSGGKALAFGADLADPAAAAGLVRRVQESFGRLDVVVHAATPDLRSVGAAELRYEDLAPYLQVYLGGALGLLAAAPSMAERRFGRLIFLGTSAMLGAPPPKWGAYLAAKHALWGLVKSLAVELGPSGITANMISPGMTVTELTAEIPARLKEIEARMVPARRLATREDTAELAAFLARPEAGYINGANLPVTGGPR